MNLIVLTSSMIDEEFNSFASKARIKPNPSNQNFYSKLIKALTTNNNVSVVSLRPLVKGMFDENFLNESESSDGTTRYYYPYIKATSSFKMLHQVDEIVSTVDKIVNEQHYSKFTLVVDTLRYSLVKAANKIAKKYNATVIGVVTDNPANISSASSSYIRSIRSHTSNYDGYILLSEGLNRVFNTMNKPYYILEGLVEDFEPVKKLPIGDYLFFGGALSERFGVKRLIDAFHKSSSPYKLVIAGDGELRRYIFDMTEKDRRILYLSMLDKNTLYGLEQNALVNINPRPYSYRMDRESVPSKLLEYFASGAPTMSTMHTKLHEIFTIDAIWVEDDSEKGLEKAIESISEYDYKELKKQATSARLKVYELYGLRNQGEGMTHFIESINSSLNK